MIQARAVVGLSLLSALLFSALIVQSASATTSSNTTAFTCVKDGSKTGSFKDAHCNSPGEGKEEYKHELIPLNVTTEVDATNAGVTEETKNSEPAVLKSKVAGGKITIECSGVKGVPKNSTQHNVESSKGQHTFTGAAQAEWSGCTVKEFEKCIVAEPIVVSTTFFGVEGLEGPKGEKNAMGVEYKGSGAEETFAQLEFKNKGAEACSINGKKLPVKGSLVGTSGPTTESAQETKSTSATIAITPKNKMQSLKLGPETAEFSVIVIPTMAGGGNPIAVTTTT
jgi:hypothetical protein